MFKGLVMDGVKSRYNAGSIVGTLIESSIRFFQFVFAIAVIGLYGQDVDKARKTGFSQDARWVYAVVVGGLASISGLIYLLIPCAIKRPLSLSPGLHLPCFVYDSVLSILWLALFGIFAKMYITVDDDENSSLKRMKHSVYVVLINLIYWTVTAGWCGWRWWKGNKAGHQEEKHFDEEQDMREV